LYARVDSRFTDVRETASHGAGYTYPDSWPDSTLATQTRLVESLPDDFEVVLADKFFRLTLAAS